jgi:hypothetical protein
MIRWTRSARIAPGKMLQAMQFAKEISEYVKRFDRIPPVSVYMESFGEVGTIRWYADYEDLASLEKGWNQLLSSPEYLDKVNQNAELFIPGSARETLMRAI